MGTIGHEPTESSQRAPVGPSRRTVLRSVGAAGAVAAAGALAACAVGGGDVAAQPTGPVSDLAKTSQIPLGGGTVFAKQLIVVTQPTSGTFKAFSAVCTHMSCTVNQVQNGQIECPCHGSQYSIIDGSVTRGAVPDQSPLPTMTVTVVNGEISVS